MENFNKEELPKGVILEGNGQTALDFDKPDVDFGGFESEEERKKVAGEYNVIDKDEIKKFVKIGSQVFHQNYSGELIPVETWFEGEKELFEKPHPHEYYKGQG